VSTRIAILWAIALSATLSGCSEASKPSSCAVTLPAGSATSEQPNYGNSALRVALWPRGRLVAGPLPDGSRYAEIKPDGSIEAKLGWWRTIAGRLSIEGERLDAQAPPLGADIPDGYGKTGLQPTGLVFPTPGCWRVVGSVAEAPLAFVVLVSKR
jgi:hypothetical protein